MTELLVPERFRGPPSSGNGGWTAGALAATLVHPDDRCTSWPAVTVVLHRPPPLDVVLPVVERDGWAVVTTQEDQTVARARLADHGPAVVEPVPASEARSAETTYAGLTSHPFPTCFACGTGRDEGDGLRIFPGRVDDAEGATRLAATWTPHPSVAEDWHAYRDNDGVRHASLSVTWAALDCIGGWAGDLSERLMVLGTMTARIDALPVIGEEHVLVGSGHGTEGRKTHTSSTLYDADGRIVACAEHVWIAVDPTDFG